MANSNLLQVKLIALLKNFSDMHGGTPPKAVYATNCHEKLKRLMVDDGVYLFSRYLGMPGSSGDVDMYRLNQAYLLDPAMQGKINDLLRGWRCPS